MGGPQYRFLKSGVRDMFYGGAAGGGKSVALIAAGLRNFGHPNYRGKIFRRTRKVTQELIIKAQRMVTRAFPGARWNGSEHVFQHPNGGRLEIGYLRHDMDLENEEGQEYQFIGLDELCQFPEHQATFLHSRLRSDSGIQLQYKGTGNPRGIGLMWVKARYIDPSPPETVIWHPTKLGGGRVVQMSSTFIPALLDDNPTLTADDDYEVSLSALPPKLYEALRWGKWDALMGDAFQEWDPAEHVMSWAQFAQRYGLVLRVRPGGQEYCDIPQHWPIFNSYDWGTAKPFSVGWWTADEQGRLIRIYEWYGCAHDRNGKPIADKGIQMPTRDQAIGILEREERWGIAGRVSLRVADASLFDDRGVDTDGPPLSEVMSEEGVYFTRADKRRIAGKQQFHDRLRMSEFETKDEDIEETAAMFIMDTCTNWLRCVPVLPACPRDPEDVDTTAEDHCLVGDTLVQTDRGPIAIRDLVGQRGWLHSFNGKESCIRPFNDVRRTQIGAPVFRVDFEDGRSITATANHPFLARDGEWTRVGNLRPGDMVRDIGSTGMMNPDTGGFIHGDHRECDGPVVPGRPVLQVWTLLPAQGSASAQNRLGVVAWAGAHENARSPQGWRPHKQPAREPGIDGAGGPSVAPQQRARKLGSQAATRHSEHGPEGGGLAFVGGGARLAQRACQEYRTESQDVYGGLSDMRRGVRDATPNAGKVLRRELQGVCPEAPTWDEAGEGAARVRDVVPAGFADVYNLDVAGTHCFAVNGGIVVHNSYDESRYMLMARPWKAKVIKEDASWLRNRRRRSGMVN
jgi:hypothetical protein